MKRQKIGRGKLFALSCIYVSIANAAFAADEPSQLGEVTVTGTREATPLTETSAAIGIIKQKDIKLTGPSHPQQILGQIPGVAINVTNGEGHTTGIRQKIGTDPVYLYLEDGIPIRATGFFNHNALYEVNIPSAGGVEVVKGIGSALYGSDAIGGTINILSNQPTRQSGAGLSVEAGNYGWYRLLGNANTGQKEMGALRADVNVSHTDGWRVKTAYDRLSGNLRWDYAPDGESVFKTILGFSKIDQQTGANSALTPFEYQNTPTVNARSVAYRKVDALRLSTNLDKDIGDNTLVSITPYFRYNSMNLNGSYNFSTAATGDPRVEKTTVTSLGLLTKWRKDLPGSMRTRVVAGFDYDYSPGKRTEDAISFAAPGCTVAGTATRSQQFNCYTVGPRIYDYEVIYQSASPYVHTEFSPVEKLRVTAAVRYDTMSYKMTNNLAAGDLANGAKHYWQNASGSRSFSKATPKIGLAFALTPSTHLHASYNQGFRAPGESNLFRVGHDTTLALGRTKAADALQLKPIKADQYEVGVRGDAIGWNYDLIYYVLKKRDDILNQRDALNQTTISSNNGSTEHRGIELGLGKSLADQLRLDIAYSYAQHTYVSWITNQFTGANNNGKDIESAPHLIANTRLTWSPTAAATAQFEWVKTGAYWLDAANTGKYNGHDLYNLRADYKVEKDLSLFGRIINLSNTRYADSAAGTGAAPTLSPGLPRTIYAGIEIKW
ncbi:TonB-dependent receptor [Candidatus Ferrigenium straubiae]|jgi:outer membrane receptor protein involved in Fe transport|uniref:TonB-dependent receptor n=1 Tax=Candidatus Ferrigenium straubiae TaxID=2919506 RepID=UPI003F4A8B40